MFKKLNTARTLFEMYKFEKELNNQLQHMQHEEKRAKAKDIINNHVGFALGAALVPFPAADLLAVSAVQLNMLRQLAKLYQINFMDSIGRTVISAVVGGSAARLGASLIKAIPGVGTLIGEMSMTVLSGASTYALGNVVANHFNNGGNLEDFDLTGARKKYRDQMEEAKKVAEDLKKQQPAETFTAPDTAMEKIKKLAEMKEAGIITEEEFSQLKSKLLAEI